MPDSIVPRMAATIPIGPRPGTVARPARLQASLSNFAVTSPALTTSRTPDQRGPDAATRGSAVNRAANFAALRSSASKTPARCPASGRRAAWNDPSATFKMCIADICGLRGLTKRRATVDMSQSSPACRLSAPRIAHCPRFPPAQLAMVRSSSRAIRRSSRRRCRTSAR